MVKLSRQSFCLARDFIRNCGRPLEQRLFEYYFEDGSAEAVISAVANYQNADGGFGHAIDPDFRLISSSPMGTVVAFRYLVEVNAPADHPVVRTGIDYLLRTYDQVRGLWVDVPREVNNVPHAPRWHQHSSPEVFQPAWNAEIVGYLNAYPALVPPEMLEKVSCIAMSCLVNLAEPMGMRELLCYLRLARELPPPRDILVLAKVRREAARVVCRDASRWSTCCAKPLTFAPTPQSPLADLLAEEVAKNLDWEIGQQSPAGSWLPSWSWDQYPETWAEACLEWQGILTVRNLWSLKSWGRIEGM